jgi:ABC-type bacteriocin/lantibiotic exporter with double-glycine peptidase domain
VCRFASVCLMVATATPVLAQDGLCGPRCAHHVLETMGVRTYLTDIIQELRMSPEGGKVSLQELADLLKRKGIACEAWRLGVLDVPRSPCPIIAHVRGDHFVVIEECGLWSASVWDGLQGSRRDSWLQLKSTGADTVLFCTPPGEEHAARIDTTWRWIAAGVGSIGLLLVLALIHRRRRHQLRSQPTIETKDNPIAIHAPIAERVGNAADSAV